MDTRPKHPTQRNRPESRLDSIDSGGRPLNVRGSAQNAASLRQSSPQRLATDLEGSPQKRPAEKLPAAAKVDTQYIRNNHYSHELRWIVEQDIGFSYGNQVQAHLRDFEKYAPSLEGR